MADDEDAVRALHRGRVGAVMALGYIVNKTGDKTALDYLIASTSPGAWQSRGLAPEGAKPIGEIQMDLSTFALFSLGLSGNADAAAHLRRLAASKGLDAPLPMFKDALAQSLQLSDEVSKNGLVEYYRTSE